MTNGEKLVKAFPDIELYKKMHGGIQIDFDSAWWNAEYKEPTTKNDLGVDAVSRQEVLYLVADYDLSMGQVVKGIHALPSVTPQEPQTFKWCTDCREYDQEKHCCHRWSKVIRDTIEEMKQEQEPRTGHWIPVSERLPEPFSFVDCTCHSLIDDREDWVVETCYLPQPHNSPYSDWGNIPMLNSGECEVIAWMYRDIPNPYKAETEAE